MVDAAVLVREHLLNQTAVTLLLGTNANGSIYCSPDLPDSFNPKLGPCIQIFRSGGMSNPEIPPLVNPRLQLRVWADVKKHSVAATVYGAVYDGLQGIVNVSLTDGTILSAFEVTGPQEITDPVTLWVSINSFYAVMARPN